MDLGIPFIGGMQDGGGGQGGGGFSMGGPSWGEGNGLSFPGGGNYSDAGAVLGFTNGLRSGIGQIFSGLGGGGSSAIDNGLASMRDYTNQANDILKNVYGEQKQMLQPWQEAGAQGLARLQAEMPDMTRQFTMNDFHNSPGYQFQLGEGQKAIERAAASRGLLNSTGTLKSLDSYSQGLANQDYQQAYNNFTSNQQQRFGMLSGLANVGQNANNQMVSASGNYGNNVSNNLLGLGNATAGAGIAQANGQNAMMNSLIGAGAAIGSAYLMSGS